MRRRKKKQNILKRIMAKLVITSIAAIAIWLYFFIGFVENITKTQADITTKTDAIIILTGGSDRLASGIELLSAGLGQKLLVSGVGQGVSLETLLITSGSALPDNIATILPNIELGFEARDTNGNAIEAAKWIKDNGFMSIRLVTANYHIPRSMIEFKKQLPDVDIIPNPIAPKSVLMDDWWNHKGTRYLLAGEFNKYIITKLFYPLIKTDS